MCKEIRFYRVYTLSYIVRGIYSLTVVYDGAIVLRESRTVDVSVHVFKMLPACYNTVYQLLRQWSIDLHTNWVRCYLRERGGCRKTARPTTKRVVTQNYRSIHTALILLLKTCANSHAHAWNYYRALRLLLVVWLPPNESYTNTFLRFSVSRQVCQ